jgi:hypothetical protein
MVDSPFCPVYSSGASVDSFRSKTLAFNPTREGGVKRSAPPRAREVDYEFRERDDECSGGKWMKQ